MAEDIKVTFIVPSDCRSENDCSEEMQMAYLACEQHSGGGLQAAWAQEGQWNQFNGLAKRDVFVLSNFKGELYEKLRATKCLLVGPRCLSCCLTEGVPIPSGPEPVFTVAMRGLVITASGLSKSQKENIKLKVHWMGGIYNTVLTDDTTHLVSDTVLSDKYVKSIEKGIPVMHESWIEAVWEASLRRNISGASSEFECHKLPIFANMQVTTSGISKRDKQMIIKLVNENGGVFSGTFQSETTDVVVLNKEGVGSEKYKAALEYGKVCVLPAWVRDSAAAGALLPMHAYRVAGASTSSPLSTHLLPDMSLNFSRITNLRQPNNFVDESRAVDITTMSGKMKLSQENKKMSDSSIDKELQNVFENFDMSQTKRTGPIFDGFCIWVTGLEGICRERALAIVSRGGGVRYDCAHERVTHVVAGASASAAAAATQLPNVPVLNALWLVRSMQAGKVLNEADYVIETKPSTPAKSARKQRVEPASPMSKRNLALLRRGPLDLPPPTAEEPEQPQDELVNHYLSQQMPEEPTKPKSPEEEPQANVTTRRTDVTSRPDVTEDMTDEPTEEVEQIFIDMNIEVQGLDDDAVCELGAEVSAAGGALCAAGAGGSHVLVPLDFDPRELVTRGAEPVTVFWVKDCLSQQELLPIQYYHRPVRLPTGSPPLEGVVASLSTYSGMERAFIDELAKQLGATTQLRFCRRNTANALASTHLICPTASGDKYTGALKWNLPAVTADWLMACVERGTRVSERPYLVGDSTAPPSPKKPGKEEPKPTQLPNPDVQEPKSDVQEPVTNEDKRTTDKENAMLPPADTDVLRRFSVPSGDDMSPASRYIAMARQGLLGSDSQETPKRHDDLKTDDKQGGGDALRTPQLEDALSSPNLAAFSPTTRRRLQALRRGEMPSDPIRTPTDPFKNPDTPDSAFGANLRPGSGRMSPDARKRLWRVVHELPGKQPDPVRDKHTPLSEIRNRYLAQFNMSEVGTPPSDHQGVPRKLLLQDQDDTPPAKMARLSHLDQSPGSSMKAMGRTEQSESEPDKMEDESSKSTSASSLPPAVDLQLQRLNAALTSRLSGQRAKRTRDSLSVPAPESEPGPASQPNTVGWDDTTPCARLSPPNAVLVKRFMLSSNVDNREEIMEMIVHLGGTVSDVAEVDPTASHLLCAAPGRSEKMLCSVAAGRWVLHPAYVARSRAQGGFLPEEQFEWGNPAATSLPPLSEAEAVLARAACRWRGVRGAGGEGPFHGLVTLLHVPPPRRKLLAKLVEAGGGQAPLHDPPYNDDGISVCFADVKRYPLSPRDAAFLKSRDIPVCAPVLLSAFLTDDPPPVPRDHCLAEFRNT